MDREKSAASLYLRRPDWSKNCVASGDIDFGAVGGTFGTGRIATHGRVGGTNERLQIHNIANELHNRSSEFHRKKPDIVTRGTAAPPRDQEQDAAGESASILTGEQCTAISNPASTGSNRVREGDRPEAKERFLVTDCASPHNTKGAPPSNQPNNWARSGQQ